MVIGGANMDYKELFFGLYAEVNSIIEQLQEIQKKYEELYCEETNN